MLRRPLVFFRYIVVGRPQLLALALLALYAGQALRMARDLPLSEPEQDHVWAGRMQLEYNAAPRKFAHAPLVNLAAALPLQLDRGRDTASAPSPKNVEREVMRLRLLLRAPFLFAGLMLGASLWYVARRLYGNGGGYVALALYCLSPAMVLLGARVDGTLPAAWGVFGVVFTAIALSHNLYAPWKRWLYRTALLTIALAIAVASHPVAMLIVPAALAFMLYLAPGRRIAALLVVGAAAAAAFVLTLAAYGFEPRALMNGIDLREWLFHSAAPSLERSADIAFTLWAYYPAAILAAIPSVVFYLLWRRTRYFGNTAPLLVFAGLMLLAWFTPMTSVAALWALPFLFVFAGGIAADLFETENRLWAFAGVLIILASSRIVQLFETAP